MLTLAEFVKKYNNEKVDFDGVYGAQCVDLVRQYFKEVWGIPQPEGVDGAKDFYFKHVNRPVQMRYCTITEYDGGMAPPAGAVVIFGANATNQYGHIGICLSAGRDTLIVFEQDGFKQDGAKVCTWNYTRMLGWLTKREE